VPEADGRCSVAAGDLLPATGFSSRRVAGSVLALSVCAGVSYAQDQGGPAGGAAAGPAGGNYGGVALPGTTPGGAGQPGGAQAGTPSFVIVPSIGVVEQFTDNALQTSTQRLSDAITIISPGVSVSDQSSRLTARFSYTPQAIEHVAVTSQDQVIQNFFGNGTFTAVPNLLFFDANTSASEASRVGGLGYGNQAQIPTSTATQTYAYSGSPYLQFHYGDYGDLELRYRFSETIFTGNTGAIASAVPGQAVSAITNGTSNEISENYTTGQAFGRLQLSAVLDFQDYNGGGGTSSKSTTATVNTSYMITNSLFALLNGGYDRLVYPGQLAGFDGAYTGPNYSAGFRYQPRQDRSVQLTYGRSQGQHEFAGNALYALTPLTTLSASYAQQNSTPQQQLLQNLSQATQLPTGAIVNQASNLPLSIINPNLALQNGVFRTQTLNGGVSMVGSQRDTYTLYFNRTIDTALSSGSFSQTTDGINFGWSRDISPFTQGSLSAGYSTTSSAAIAGVGNTSSDALTFSASLNYGLTPTLTASASYQLTRQDGIAGTLTGGTIGSTSGSVLIDLITLSLNKSF
jgi:uncharacterized protein (PEP-CTERM system associated)